MKHLKENSPQLFKQNLEPSKGLHIFVELDENGNAVNFPGKKGENWDYYDGKEKSEFINNIVPYDLASRYITMNKQKKFDAKQKIHSASPFVLAFNFNFNDKDLEKYGIKKKPDNKIKNNKFLKAKRVEIIQSRINDYFKKTEEIFKLDNEIQKQQKLFKLFLIEKIIKNISDNPKNFIEIDHYWRKLKKTEYCKIYFKNISIDIYESIYEQYLNENIFNKEKYNLEYKNGNRGVLDFYTTFSDKKIFLKHKTSMLKDGISYRFKGINAKYLQLFLKLKNSKIFPNPLPIFIDKNEFLNTDEILRIFKENGKLTYSQILKKLFKENENRILQNYYLLFFSGLKIEDFDFVSKFRYSMKENNEYPEIKNLFGLKENKEFKGNYYINNIFQFESSIIKTIFNNSLVKIDEKNNSFSVNYFNEIKAEYVSGGELVYQMILKYRKAFYDYIYKSKTQAINSIMWDEIMWNSILGDIRTDKITDKGYHSKGYSVKEKLNIWFSLYNYFDNKKRRKDMATKIPELLEKMKTVANNDDIHFDSTEEFAFGAGQIIYYLLNQSKASEKTHALLEPFIQKVKADQLQNAISRTINMYKHELSFGHGRFERLSSEVLGFDTNENLKKYQRLLLAGYFATPVIFEKKIMEEVNE